MANIDLDYADYKTINKHKGYCIGFNSEIVLIDTLEVELLNKFKKHFHYAKGILIKYSLNENQSLCDIKNIMGKIDDNIKNSTPSVDIILGTEDDSSVKLGECKFQIIITGLEKL